MRVAILDGHPGPGGEAFERWIGTMADELSSRGHEVSVAPLRGLNIQSCRGCWGCWVKTPGRCVIQDDMEGVLTAVGQADWLILASPLPMGFVSARLKRCMDRLIPLVHPYIEIEGGECHHRPRYAKAPKLGAVLERETIDVEDIDITTDLLSRLARNMKTRLLFTRLTSQPVEEVCHAIDHL